MLVSRAVTVIVTTSVGIVNALLPTIVELAVTVAVDKLCETTIAPAVKEVIVAGALATGVVPSVTVNVKSAVPMAIEVTVAVQLGAVPLNTIFAFGIIS